MYGHCPLSRGEEELVSNLGTKAGTWLVCDVYEGWVKCDQNIKLKPFGATEHEKGSLITQWTILIKTVKFIIQKMLTQLKLLTFRLPH